MNSPFPDGVRKADYWFPSDNVVAVLKCLSKDLPEEGAFHAWVLSMYESWIEKALIRPRADGRKIIDSRALPEARARVSELHEAQIRVQCCNPGQSAAYGHEDPAASARVRSELKDAWGKRLVELLGYALPVRSQEGLEGNGLFEQLHYPTRLCGPKSFPRQRRAPSLLVDS
jgi:hypothetical protein